MKSIISVVAICFFAIHSQLLHAQKWLSELDRSAQPMTNEQMNFYTIRDAFNNYYTENPLDISKEGLRPKFSFPTKREEREKTDYEDYKMFKRWEWFAEPRVYPTGTWDLDQIAAQMINLKQYDEDMLKRQWSQRLFPDIQIRDNLVIWPLIPTWSSSGPSNAVGGSNLGRVNCITFDPNNSNTIYVGAPNGGIWKSITGGASWAPIFDFQPTISIADIAIHKSDSKIIYAATGDGFGYGNPFWGGTYSVGVMKSIDGGTTWAPTGLTWNVGFNRTIRRLVIHPKSAKILMAATSDGLYRTDDAGASWAKIINRSAYDIEFDVSETNIAYATVNNGGNNNILMKSTNDGLTFTNTTATCTGGRYNVEIAESNTKIVYTLCTNGVVQKSTNKGLTWVATTSPGVTLYGYYDNVLSVSPVKPDHVYVAGFNIKQTNDGGATWTNVNTAIHVDNHVIEFLPGSNTTIYCGNDGGIFRSINSGTTWASLNKGLAITQFYRMGASRTNSNLFLAGAQDNGNMRYNTGVWSNITNADGMGGFIDWNNTNNYYVTIQYGGLSRSTNAGVSWTNISTPSGGAWVTPFTQHPTIANTIFAGTDKVYRSNNQGTNWTGVSPAGMVAGTYTILKISTSNTKAIYAGNGGSAHRSFDYGSTWTNITAGLPVATNYLTDLTVSDKDHRIVYATFSGYVSGNKVYKSTDGGSTWANISGTLPNIPVNCLLYENSTKNGLYIGTDAGIYYRNDDMTDWVPYKWGLPNVIVNEMEINYSSKRIRAATYGRGMWIARAKGI